MESKSFKIYLKMHKQQVSAISFPQPLIRDPKFTMGTSDGMKGIYRLANKPAMIR
jgi:hypothetical protein